MGTTNTICGYDHVNSYSILYEGIRLSRNSYWDNSYETDTCGVTTLTVGSDGSGTVEHHYIHPQE